jgi:hypothetical protein
MNFNFMQYYTALDHPNFGKNKTKYRLQHIVALYVHPGNILIPSDIL